jgi:hypothetical protein
MSSFSGLSRCIIKLLQPHIYFFNHSPILNSCVYLPPASLDNNNNLTMSPRILLLGGHGKVSLLLTPKLLARSWNLTSVIRNLDQKGDILEAGKNGPGKLDVLVSSIEDVKSEADAKKILDQVKPEWVVWSAGTSLSHISL